MISACRHCRTGGDAGGCRTVCDNSSCECQHGGGGKRVEVERQIALRHENRTVLYAGPRPASFVPAAETFAPRL